MTNKTPFMWAGSKDKNYKDIKKYIPDFDHYNEPFLGGGSVYFRLLAERGLFNASCADINNDLITTYEIIRDKPDELINNLPLIKDRKTFDDYSKSNPVNKLDIAIKFLYMNRNRFFGMGGWMNADRYARNEVISRIEYFSPLMQKTMFYNSCNHFNISKNSFTFCDPPYIDTNNKACYNINDDEIFQLNINYLNKISNSDENFLFITKYNDEFYECIKNMNINIEKKEWTYRKPQQLPQVSYELYIKNRLVLY